MSAEDPIIQEVRDIAASLSLDMANARAERWRVRTMEARVDTEHFMAEYDHACEENESLRAKVAALADVAEVEHPWWIADGAPEYGAAPILGPFESRELALRVRALFEAHESANGMTYWIGQAPRSGQSFGPVGVP